ncbi:MAG: hypothetical protein CL582_21820 [Alteromonadaceae bacterium]|nr:hypothetical protein [Alteromonadaceae bacterium]|tara:strand:- start:198 stop:866 length:669 start_codon:yes stop_codon:yes gene_type:complete
MTKPSKYSLVGGGPITPRQAFTNRETHPLILNLLLLKEFGLEYLGWEPETCWIEIGRSWNTTISEINRNKIQAIRTCHVSDSPYEKWETFEKVAMGFVGLTPKFDLIQKATPHRAALALDVMGQVREKQPISDEIYKYVAAVMMDSGIVYGPGPMEPSNKYLTKFVNSGKQAEVRDALLTRKKPTFSGNNENDIQLMKAISIKDFLESASRMLLTQLKKLIP